MSPHGLCVTSRWCWLVMALVALTATDAAPPRLDAAPDNVGCTLDNPFRLHRSVLPSQYKLRLVPDLDGDSFEGHVDIRVRAEEAVGKIRLHAERITLLTARVTRVNDASSGSLFRGVVYWSDCEMIEINLAEDLVVGEEYDISMDYHGELRDDMYGFYVSTYTIGDVKKRLAATQFQATHARKAFPCFDEPNFKARFEISVVAPPGYFCLSNMPVKEEKDLTGGSREFIFKNSPIMSPYLVAFVVSDFSNLDDEDNQEGGVHIKTWARENALDRADYSLKVSRKMLDVLEDYTNIPYIDDGDDVEFPFNKIDQVALPDFSAGAMENWGLITYRETALLYDYDNGPATSRRSVAVTIAHELLHMWFGNLVTTHWWGATWLNEGFARSFQYYVTDKVEAADWRMWDQFVVDQQQAVFALDSLVTVKALTHDVTSPAEASASFGTITYNKGGSVLRMISNIIGAENFQQALQDYLVAHKYGTVTPQDLFNALKPYAPDAQLSETDFESFLRSWTEQPGFPVLNVIRNYESNSAIVLQKRFLFEGEQPEKYYVPLTWVSQGSAFDIPKPGAYHTPDTDILTLSSMPPSNEWVIFNVQEAGYYRVNYDSRNWELVSQYLKDASKPLDGVHVLNRAQLLDDAFNLARAGLLPYATALGLADYLSREADYVPWSAALAAFAYLERMLVNHDKYPVFKGYVLRLIDKLYEHYQFSVPDRHDEKLLLNKLATWACRLDNKKCNEAAESALKAYVDDNVPVAPDLRSVVYCYGVRALSGRYWEAMWDKYRTSQDDVERGLIVAGLSCSSDEARLRQLLGYSITLDGPIRRQDAASVFSSVYGNPLGVEVALEFLDENFEAIRIYYGSMGSINNIVTGIAGRLTTLEQRNKLQSFIEKHADNLGATAQSALATVDDNLKWVTEYQDIIFSVFEDKVLKQYRLDPWVRPERYILRFEPDLEAETFTGHMYIILSTDIETDVITLHSQGIQVNYVSVQDGGWFPKEIYHSHSYDETLEFLHLYTKEPMFTYIDYIIYMEFSGTLRDNMYGFYISKYDDDNNNERRLAATQFQPTHARKAFPCFDEPNFKRMTSPQKHSFQSLRKCPHIFWQSSFPISSIIFRTWARPNALPWADYSLQISRSLLETLEVYTSSNYTDRTQSSPFDKVDQVALPDFSAGAMENWGLVTYRESMLLFNDGTAFARKGIATVIAHELTHMWFGNLVTTHWWDATWLNEGFAQYFQYYITDKVKPDWRLMDQFLVDTHQGVFASDSLISVAALSSPAYTPAQVSGRFGGITYSKGAAVIRMLSSIIGEDQFQKALQVYLRRNRYSTTTPDDLFEVLKLHAHETGLSARYFDGFLRSWTERPGFPVITVRRDSALSQVRVTQSRFLLRKPSTEDPTLYFVPLTWVVQGEDFSVRKPQGYLLDIHKETVIPLQGQNDKWILFNVQSTAAFAAFSYLQRMLIRNERYSVFQNYILNLLEERYRHFNFEDQDNHIDKLLLNRVSAWACSLEHTHCTNTARDSLHSFLDRRILVPADLRSVVYCYGIRHSASDYWHKLLNEYKESKDSAERALLMLLEYSIEGTFIRRQDASSVFTNVYSNARGVEVALNFLDNNFDKVLEYYGSMGAISNIVVGIAGRLTTERAERKLEAFLTRHESNLGKAVTAAALETVDENLEWLKENDKTILDVLERHNWGLITYRETALLFDEANGPESARRRVAVVIAHELAHMWFGNLATTAQWDTTWLNEGFAEYFEYLAVDGVHPEWRMREQFVVDDMMSALAADAFVTANPLTRAVCSPADATGAFESLTYTKGASVLRMFSYIVGEDNFREALRRYLNANAFKAVEPEELFRELKVYSEEAGLSYPEMDELLHTWTEQSGYPMVLVMRDYKERTARISQVRYQTMPLRFDYPPFYVPLTWTQRGFGFDVGRPQLYLTTDEPSKVMEGMPSNDTWVIFNIQRTGFYRVNYDFTNWELITNYLNSEANPLDGIHVLNRAQLVDDVLAFGRSGNLPYTNILQLLDYLHRETDYMPWTAFFNGISYINRMLLNREEYPRFKVSLQYYCTEYKNESFRLSDFFTKIKLFRYFNNKNKHIVSTCFNFHRYRLESSQCSPQKQRNDEQYVLNLILKLYNRFEFKTQQTHLDNLLLNQVSSWACALDHPHCTTSAVTLLQEFLDGGKPALNFPITLYKDIGPSNIFLDNFTQFYKKL
ncbi:Aminopeptidase N [Gryllus bimaculatus]|nr:Aminopeptidase N [Gryllus bimaculatus]